MIGKPENQDSCKESLLFIFFFNFVRRTNNIQSAQALDYDDGVEGEVIFSRCRI